MKLFMKKVRNNASRTQKHALNVTACHSVLQGIFKLAFRQI